MTLTDLQTILGIEFKDMSFYEQAFIHRSYLNESKNITISNERMEFLGDSILSFLTSNYLYTTYPQYHEGILTNVRSSLVKTTSLAEAAKEIGLGKLLMLSHGEEASGGRNNSSLLADSFEALLGAIFLDQGLDAVKIVLNKFLFNKTPEIVESKSYVDYKSLLQEIIQQESRISPTYQVTKSEGPDHAKTFWVQVVANQSILGAGTGKSKQEAEQSAALNALEKMKKV